MKGLVYIILDVAGPSMAKVVEWTLYVTPDPVQNLALDILFGKEEPLDTKAK